MGMEAREYGAGVRKESYRWCNNSFKAMPANWRDKKGGVRLGHSNRSAIDFSFPRSPANFE
jgi:hypothetical protein